MRLIVHLADFGWPIETSGLGPLLADIGGLTEAGGFDGLAVGDHFWRHPIMGGPDGACLEAYTTLAFLAAHTSAVRLLTVATGAHFRSAGLLAKTVTTLDVLSGGRAWLGIGAGHYQEECQGLGAPFPVLSERYDLLIDALEIALAMWADRRGPYHGRTVDAADLLCAPAPLSRPHPPVLVAGDGERRTLPIVARYADACCLRPGPDIPRKLDLLHRLCDDAGRDYDRIERACVFAFRVEGSDGGGGAGGAVGPATRELIDQLQWLASMGIETVIGRVEGIEQRWPLEVLGRQVVPAVLAF